MMAIAAAVDARLRAALDDRLTRNIGWYGLTEIANRITRLVTAIIVARTLLPEDFGLAATAITVAEIVGLIAMTGIGQAVVRAREEDLAAVLNTARRASTLACLVAVAVQLAIGLIIALYTGRSDVFWMIACLAGVYPILLPGQMQAHLVVRANRLHVLAIIAVIQLAVDNLLTAGFALAGFGAWAIVLPKLLTAPIWVLGMRRAASWSRDPAAGEAPLWPLAKFATAVIVSDLLVAARFNLDKAIVGTLLGLEALGIYYFVCSAGIGLSLALTSSLSASVYPHLAELSADRKAMLARYDDLVWRAAVPVASLLAIQAALAPLYVPLVFGERWAPHAHLVAILCASVIAKPTLDCAFQLLRAAGLPKVEMVCTGGLALVSLSALALGLTLSLEAGIAVFAITTAVSQFTLALLIRRRFGAG